MRGPEDEERGISTPRVSQEKPPPSMSSQKEGRASARLVSAGLRPLAWRRPLCAARRPRARPSPPSSHRAADWRGRGHREPPGSQGLMGPRSGGRGGGGKWAPGLGASSGIANS